MESVDTRALQKEIEDIILFHLYKQDEKYGYEDITYLPSAYAIEIEKNELTNICGNLGEERKLNWKEDQNRIEAKLLPAGHEYVKVNLFPLIIDQKMIPFEELTAVLKELNRVDDFEFIVDNTKEGAVFNYTPSGKFSERYFRVIRMKFLYYAVSSNPKVQTKNKTEFKEVINAFRTWLTLLEDSSDSDASDGSPTLSSTTNQSQASGSVRSPVFFAVGSYWSGDDQTKRFFKEGVWENGKDEGDEDVMNEVMPNDTFVLKSSFSKDGSSILRVKGIGKVTARKGDYSFLVDWLTKDITIDIENLGFYRKTIEQLKLDDWNIINSRLANHFTKNSNVKLQHDAPSDIDLLNRRPFAKAVADYVSRLWKDQQESAYTIHLRGEWGSGKSNVLKFLGEDLESRGWLVLSYNAWEYQHIENPWWMFLNKVFKQILTKIGFMKRLRFRIKEFCWRLFVINRLSWFSFIFIGALAVIFLWNLPNSTAKTTGPDWLSLLGAILATGGSLWLLFKGLSGSLLPASDEAAQNFQKNINDPVELVRDHFQSMVKFPKKNIAIFIDDIDRCSSKNVVRLLEGIQTIFKSSKVLYVFAGDASWVRRSFEIEYDGFSQDFKRPEHSLGNFFVEKVFQMSISIPVVTENTLKSFLTQTLRPNFTPANKTDAGDFIVGDFSSAQNETEIENALSKYRGTENESAALEAAVEQLSSSRTLNDIEHELESYYQLLPGNVRSIKRFINNYAIARQTLLLQRVSFADVPMDILVRWLILSSRYPILAEELIKRPALMNDFKGSPFESIINSQDFKTLSNNQLTEQKIKLIAGK